MKHPFPKAPSPTPLVPPLSLAPIKAEEEPLLFIPLNSYFLLNNAEWDDFPVGVWGLLRETERGWGAKGGLEQGARHPLEGKWK